MKKAFQLLMFTLAGSWAFTACTGDEVTEQAEDRPIPITFTTYQDVTTRGGNWYFNDTILVYAETDDKQPFFENGSTIKGFENYIVLHADGTPYEGTPEYKWPNEGSLTFYATNFINTHTGSERSGVYQHGDAAIRLDKDHVQINSASWGSIDPCYAVVKASKPTGFNFSYPVPLKMKHFQAKVFIWAYNSQYENVRIGGPESGQSGSVLVAAPLQMEAAISLDESGEASMTITSLSEMSQHVGDVQWNQAFNEYKDIKNDKVNASGNWGIRVIPYKAEGSPVPDFEFTKWEKIDGEWVYIQKSTPSIAFHYTNYYNRETDEKIGCYHVYFPINIEFKAGYTYNLEVDLGSGGYVKSSTDEPQTLFDVMPFPVKYSVQKDDFKDGGTSDFSLTE